MIQQHEQPALPYDGPAEATVTVEGLGTVVQQAQVTLDNRYANGFNVVGPGQAERAKQAMAEYRRIRDERRAAAGHV